MTTTPTSNPIPSEAPQDLKFNAGKIDEFVTSSGWTYTDRFGVKRYTIEGINYLAKQSMAAFGYITLDSFQAGASITLPNQVLRDTSSGEYYRWDGAIPKTVPANSTPSSTGGVGTGKWLSVGNATLLTGDGNGVGYRYKSLTNATHRSVRDKLDEKVSLWDFHCDANGSLIQPGVSIDSRPYIQNAIDYLAANSGGTLIIPVGTWYLSSMGGLAISGHSGVIQLKTNVNIKFESGAIIKLTAYFNNIDFQVFVGFDNSTPSLSGDLKNVHINGDGIIDFGSNLMKSAGNLRNGISFGRSYDCSVSDITFQNGDMTWAVTTGWNGYGARCKIYNCKFINLIMSNFNKDHSTVYVGSIFSGVDSCIFLATNSRAREIACTVELHQHNQYYTNCLFDGYTRGVYVVMHSAESEGAGLYHYGATVLNNSGSITGQFVIFSATNETGIAHVSDVLVAGNNVSIGNNRTSNTSDAVFVEIAPSDAGSTVGDISRINITGNNFSVPAAVANSFFLNVRSNSSGVNISNNIIDCRKAINSPVGSTLAVNGLTWQSNNVFGISHAGARAGINLFQLSFNMTSCDISVKLTNQDVSMYSVILIPATNTVSYTSVRLDPAFTTGMSNTVVCEGNQQGNTSNYFEYPKSLDFTSFNTTGAMPCYSNDTTLGWVGSATTLSAVKNSSFSGPASYSLSNSGQICGIGYQAAGAVRTYTANVLLKSIVNH